MTLLKNYVAEPTKNTPLFSPGGGWCSASHADAGPVGADINAWLTGQRDVWPDPHGVEKPIVRTTLPARPLLSEAYWFEVDTQGLADTTRRDVTENSVADPWRATLEKLQQGELDLAASMEALEL